jgi:hypothetical protein
MIITFKDRKLGNSLSIFNHYKRMTGNSLEKDILMMQKRQSILDNPKASEEEIDKAYQFDPIETIQYIYYAMRCAGEGKSLNPDIVMDELEIEDITSGKLTKVIEQLLTSKKNN